MYKLQFRLFVNQIEDSDEEDDPEFRYLSSDCGIQPSKRNNYGIPRDVIDMFRVSGNRAREINDSEAPKTNESDSGASQPSQPNTIDDVINNRLEQVTISYPLNDIDKLIIPVQCPNLTGFSESTRCR